MPTQPSGRPPGLTSNGPNAIPPTESNNSVNSPARQQNKKHQKRQARKSRTKRRPQTSKAERQEETRYLDSLLSSEPGCARHLLKNPVVESRISQQRRRIKPTRARNNLRPTRYPRYRQRLATIIESRGRSERGWDLFVQPWSLNMPAEHDYVALCKMHERAYNTERGRRRILLGTRRKVPFWRWGGILFTPLPPLLASDCWRPRAMRGGVQAISHAIARALQAAKNRKYACEIHAHAGEYGSYQLQHDRLSAATLEDLRRATRWRNVASVAAFTGSMLDCHAGKSGITAALHRVSTRWRICAELTKKDLYVVRKSTRWRQLIVVYVNPLLGTGTCRCRTERIYDVAVQERGRE